MTKAEKETEMEIKLFLIAEKYILTLKLREDDSEYRWSSKDIATLIIGNIRAYHAWLYENNYINMDMIE